jgi:nucleoside-diphosphate-sugar epimerase
LGLRDLESETSLRVVLAGAGSFIAREVAAAGIARGWEMVGLPRGAVPVLRSTDVMINFAIHPRYRTDRYAVEEDCDLRAARVCRSAGARFVMLSTRRVYSNAWDADENAPAPGDGSAYGGNKARSEKAVFDVMGSGALVLRLSNIFGYEFAAGAPRRSFMGLVLSSLKDVGEIRYDMHPDTRRDFLPVSRCANAILDAAGRAEGIYNVGCGFPVRCGDVASWLIEGYGKGRLIAADTIRDEFFLDTGKWDAQFAPLTSREELRETCLELGQRLKCERS